MKVVLDTNVLLSGLMLPGSVPGKIVQSWLDKQFDLVVSETILGEIARALKYPKVSRRLCWTDEDIRNFIILLRLKSEVVSIKGIKAKVPRDRGDDHILKALIASNAEYLVSGDSDLLVLAGTYSILRPAEFVRLL